MKKYNVMKITAVVLVAILISTTIASNVFAKFMSKDDSTNTASVAKWGAISSSKGTLFTNKDEEGNVIVAPGDKSTDEGLLINVGGTPEIDGKITFTSSHQNIFLSAGIWGCMVQETNMSQDKLSLNTYYTIDENGHYLKESQSTFDSSKTYYYVEYKVAVGNDGYWPIVFTLDGAGTRTYASTMADETQTNTLEGVEKTLKDVLDNKQFTAKEDFTRTIGLNQQSITWKWLNCTNDCTNDGIVISNGESQSLCDNCLRDRILQKLITEKKSTTKSVVISKDEGETFVIPNESSNGNYQDGDYNLNVQFDLKIIFEQTN